MNKFLQRDIVYHRETILHKFRRGYIGYVLIGPPPTVNYDIKFDDGYWEIKPEDQLLSEDDYTKFFGGGMTSEKIAFKKYEPPKCECGANKVKDSGHALWCDIK